MKRLSGLRFGLALALAVSLGTVSPSWAAPSKRVQVTGEVIDTWCYVTEIMFAEGTAHYQCAVWCALGGHDPCAAANPCNPCNPCAAANPCNPCNPCAATSN